MGSLYHDPTSSAGTVSAIKANPAVYMILAENPWNTRATTNINGAFAKQNTSVDTKARPKPVRRGAWREALRSANQPATAVAILGHESKQE